MKFAKNDHEIWSTLIQRQLPLVERFACKEFLEGLRRVQFSNNKIPTLVHLNKRIVPLTGWSIVRTSTHYLDQKQWYAHTTKKEFPTTSYLRTKSQLDFTPDPDMFHDLFGHVPFVAIPEVVEILEMFAQAYRRVKTKKQSKELARLAWFSYEFGLLKERGTIKLFGAGILSSQGETLNVMSGRVPTRAFSVGDILKRNKSLGSFNSELFVSESLGHMKKELSKYFNSL